LSASSISRLKHTKHGLSQRVLNILSEIETQVSSANSFKIYRQELKGSNLPTIPFL